MALNIITANFCSGATQTWTEEAYQWDYGQVLQFEGLDLPDAYQVHFSNVPLTGTTITQIGGADGVTVPDQFFTGGETIYAWVYLHEGEDDGETVYMVTIPVKKRPQPSDDVPTPVEQSAIDQAIAALNIAVEKADEAITHYPTIIDGTWHVWDVTEEEYVDTGVQAQGEPGEPGHDYILTEQDKEEIASMVEVPGADFHICTSGEYDPTTRVPTIQNPDTNVFYLVPAESGSSPDMFVEWIYANNAWEMFGSASVDLTGYVRDTASVDGVTLSATGDVTHYGICESPGDEIVKIVTCPGFKLITGARVIVKFTSEISAAGTYEQVINVNNTGAKTVYYRGYALKFDDVYFSIDRVYEFIYDGVNYNLVGDLDTLPKFATDGEIKSGTGGNKAISAFKEHAATFYGLAKAAGDTTQKNSSNAIGNYTDAAKTAIQTMLGVSGGSVTVDDELSTTSTNPVQNKVITEELNSTKADLSQLQDGKLDAPSTAGTSGQVLTSDGEGGQYWHTQSGGGGGTSDYTDLTNKPQINSVTLTGNKSLSDFGIASADDLDNLDTEINGTESIVETTKTADDFTLMGFYINANTGYWSSANNRGYIGELGNCVKVAITANSSKPAEIAFLSNGTPVADTPAPIVGGSTPTTVTTGQTVELDVPATATHFYFRRMDNNGYSMVPATILFYSYESNNDGLVSTKQDKNISFTVNTKTELISENEEKEIATNSSHTGCTVSVQDNVITLNVPASTGVQWIWFGGTTGMNPQNSTLTGNVKTVLEFDCVTTSAKTDATIVDLQNGQSAVRIPQGSSHVVVEHEGNSVKYVYLYVQDYAQSQITLTVSNIKLYYAVSETISTTVVDGIAENKEGLYSSASQYQKGFQNPCIQPLVIDNDENIYASMTTYNGASKAYEDEKIVLTPVSTWTTTQQWVLFGNSGIPVANYIPNTFVPAMVTLEFDYSTTAANAKVYLTNKSSGVTDTKLRAGENLHFKKQYNYTTVNTGFINIESSSDAGKSISIWNVRLYYGSKYDGTTITDFVRFISDLALRVDNSIQYKKLLSIGDSLSNICPWQPYVQKILDIPSMTKVGGVGYTVADVSSNSIYDSVHALSADANVDLVVFWGGTNDYGEGVTIGDFDAQLDTSTRDVTTFYGAYMDCVEYLLGLYPDKRIVLVGTTIRSSGGDDGKDVDARTHANSAGKTLIDYVDAAKKVAEWYGLPFIDLLRTAGISMKNIDEYLYIQGTSANQYYLHLNDWGSEQIGKRIGRFIKSVG